MRLFARAVVKYRWAVIGLWVLIGAFAMMQARHTPERLDLRGGSTRETEAVLADRLLQGRFSRSIGEFFAITLEAPSPSVEQLRQRMQARQVPGYFAAMHRGVLVRLMVSTCSRKR
mgnify:CR=1 FL=1